MTEKKEPGEDYPEGLLDGDPRFQEAFLESSGKFWEKEDPEFYKMMQKHRSKVVPDKDSN